MFGSCAFDCDVGPQLTSEGAVKSEIVCAYSFNSSFNDLEADKRPLSSL